MNTLAKISRPQNLLISVIMALIALVCFSTPSFAYDENDPEEVDYTTITSKIANSGNEGTLNEVNFTLNSANNLCSEDANGRATIIYDGEVTAFAVYGTEIYMAVSAGANTSFIALNTTTKATRDLLTLRGEVKTFSIKDGEIYYLEDYTIYQGDNQLLTKVGMTDFELQLNGDIGVFTNEGYYNYDSTTQKFTLLTRSEEYSTQNYAGLSATSFSPRLSAPGSTNDYYYSSKNLFYASGFGMPNCTAYAYGRAYEILGKAPSLCTGNAGKWYDYNVAGKYYPYGQAPKLGAIAVWANDSSHNKGHVAVVEKVSADGTVTISESHYGGATFLTKTGKITSLYSNKRFLGFIYIIDDGISTTETVATPTITAANATGGKTITINCATPGATIYYTTDGSLPSTSSKKYTGAFNVSSTTKVKAIGVKASMTNSYPAEETITISSAAAPTANLNSNTVIARGSTVILSSATNNATIYYTTNGDIPTSSSTKYSGGIPVGHSMIIRAIAQDSGGSQSAISAFQYTTWDNPFTDMVNNTWYFSDVAQAYDNNFINGISTTSFMPEGKTSRAMFVTILSRMLEANDTANYECNFADVPSDTWFTDAIAWAESTNIVKGVGNNCFAPNANITREQACVIMVNYAASIGIPLEAGASTSSFSDAKLISSYAVEAVAIAEKAGLINGRDNGKFDPQGTATRAEITAIIMRMDRLYLQ